MSQQQFVRAARSSVRYRLSGSLPILTLLVLGFAGIALADAAPDAPDAAQEIDRSDVAATDGRGSTATSDEPEGSALSDDDTGLGDKPGTDTHYEYYRDSDDFATITATSLTSVSLGNFLISSRRQSVAAHDSLGGQRAESRVYSAFTNLSESLRVGGAIGIVRTSLLRSDFVGSIQSRATLMGATITTSVSRDLLDSTAETIRNDIRQTDLGFSIEKEILDRFTTNLEYHHKLYTDRNSSNELQFSPRYGVSIWGYTADFGYRFKYVDFARQRGEGYFDPAGMLAHEVFGALSFDRTGYYGTIELALGHQSCRRSGLPSIGLTSTGSSSSQGITASGDLTLGFRVGRNLQVEFSASGDDDALGRATAWKSLTTGFRLTYRFQGSQ